MPPRPEVVAMIRSSDPTDERTLEDLAVEAGLELEERDRRFAAGDLERHRRA